MTPRLHQDWSFTRSSPSLIGRLTRLKSQLTGWARFPAFEVVKRRGENQSRWGGYFAFCPAGGLEDYHRETIARLRCQVDALGIVVATPEPYLPADPALDAADLLIRKELGGFDFSAYALLVDSVSRLAPGADLLLMNDSVFGPFGSLDSAWQKPWHLTGFTASSQFENHIQSYAFILRGVTGKTLGALEPALTMTRACDEYRDAVNLQETRFARIAARSMSVGSLYFDLQGGNPVLDHAVALCNAGFPFLKRSLVGRYSAMQDVTAIDAFLRKQGIAPSSIAAFPAL